MCRFEDVRESQGWGPALTARTRAVPSSEWRKKRVARALTEALRKAKASYPGSLKAVNEIDDYIVPNIQPLAAFSDTGDTQASVRHYKNLAIRALDRGSQSAFLA